MKLILNRFHLNLVLSKILNIKAFLKLLHAPFFKFIWAPRMKQTFEYELKYRLKKTAFNKIYYKINNNSLKKFKTVAIGTVS